MTGRSVMSWVLAAVIAVGVAGCTDGTPAFCSSLRSEADLRSIGDALDAGDLDVASAERARRLTDLADEAPPELRGDLRALGQAVVDIVDLLSDQVSGAVNADEIERRRDQLNDDLSRPGPTQPACVGVGPGGVRSRPRLNRGWLGGWDVTNPTPFPSQFGGDGRWM